MGVRFKNFPPFCTLIRIQLHFLHFIFPFASYISKYYNKFRTFVFFVSFAVLTCENFSVISSHMNPLSAFLFLGETIRHFLYLNIQRYSFIFFFSDSQALRNQCSQPTYPIFFVFGISFSVFFSIPSMFHPFVK